MSARAPFVFSSESGRFAVGTHDLHCGECFQILRNGTWLNVRIERAGAAEGRWYVTGDTHDNAADLEGFPARLYD